MKKGDIIFTLALVGLILVLLIPTTHSMFINLTVQHAYIAGFLKFCIFATMGELLAIRIVSREWNIPKGLIYRLIIWGLIGMAVVLMFEMFSAGVRSALSKGLLPGKNYEVIWAFFVSLIMNSTFGVVLMGFHRVTDTYIDLKYEKVVNNVNIADIVRRIDWESFISFVILKTIPFFWIPAHTVAFLLPPEYRVLFAALLSIALGAILAFAKRTQRHLSIESQYLSDN